MMCDVVGWCMVRGNVKKTGLVSEIFATVVPCLTLLYYATVGGAPEAYSSRFVMCVCVCVCL